jgi:hypothetical protein
MRFSDNDYEEESQSDGDYEVGYGKPPKHSRFKPGHSGNRLGKPSGTKNSATLLKRALLESVVIKRHGRKSKATKLEVIVTQIVKQAVLGDFASIRLLLHYTGLDHELHEVQKAGGGLSDEAAEMIRCALLGKEYLAEKSGQSDGAASGVTVDAGRKPQGFDVTQKQAYRVGYGKPPLHTRFQKGRSGNPAGRPRISKNLRSLTLHLLNEEVLVTENGRQHLVSRRQLIFKQIVTKAALGELRFQTLLIAYAPVMDLTLRRSRCPSKNAFERVRKRLFSDL